MHTTAHTHSLLQSSEPAAVRKMRKSFVPGAYPCPGERGTNQSPPKEHAWIVLWVIETGFQSQLPAQTRGLVRRDLAELPRAHL
jgi:hypothetical protein